MKCRTLLDPLTRLVYVPQVNDCVIGGVTQVYAEEYEVDINSSHSGRLNTVAFEGATKRNRPYLKVGFQIRCDC